MIRGQDDHQRYLPQDLKFPGFDADDLSLGSNSAPHGGFLEVHLLNVGLADT